MYIKPVVLGNVPHHIAIIMDGNGRWAKKNFLPKKIGHKSGAETLKKISKFCNENGVKFLTVYAFSTENWKREKSEVDYLMKLLSSYLDEFIEDKDGTNIKVDIIGDESKLSDEIREKIRRVRLQSANYDGLCLCIAINYGGRDEITRAIKKIGQDVKNNKLSIEEIDETLINSYLDTKNFPDPDLLIRTSNEFRLSNFLLWQLAYSEMYFVEKLWPDFNEQDLIKAIKEFQKRDRRFGGR